MLLVERRSRRLLCCVCRGPLPTQQGPALPEAERAAGERLHRGGWREQIAACVRQELLQRTPRDYCTGGLLFGVNEAVDQECETAGDPVGGKPAGAGEGDQSVRHGRNAVAKADTTETCGWVVDLRSTNGGNMWPMLAVVGPILGDGKVGAFVDADGNESVWSIKHGSPYADGQLVGWGDGRPLPRSPQAVAVLTGRQTASAGEAVTVAFRGRPDTRFFGEQTNGVPTGNRPYRLSDGAVLLLTEAKDVDRTDRAYDAPMPPDAEVVKDPRPAARNRDEVLQAAQSWLLKQAACRRP